MDNMNTATATHTRKIKLNDLVALKDGTTVRIVRIKAGEVWFQNAVTMVIEGVPGWMLGANIASVQVFSNLVAR